MIDFLLGLFVCLFVSPSLCLGRFGQLLCYADKHIVTIMKVYIERNNLQVELISSHRGGRDGGTEGGTEGGRDGEQLLRHSPHTHIPCV